MSNSNNKSIFHDNNNQSETLYDILGVSRNATSDEIRQSYLSKVKNVHPDKSKEIQGHYNDFIIIQKAWEILRDNNLRDKYNQSLIITNKSIENSTIYEIDLDDCEYNDDNGEYKTKCRCGQKIIFYDDDLEQVCLYFIINLFILINVKMLNIIFFHHILIGNRILPMPNLFSSNKNFIQCCF